MRNLSNRIAAVFDNAISYIENNEDEFMLVKMQGRVQKGYAYKSTLLIDGNDYENRLVCMLNTAKEKVLKIVEEEQNEL